MKVFISWSGATSRAVAEALAEWLPKVVQSIDPFVSAKDIDKGANWTVELARELEDAEFGVICLAPDNLSSPWLNYEAGAITKSVHSRVCPVLFGVEKSDVKAPIAQLQMTAIEPEDFKLLLASMNKVAGDAVPSAALDEAIEVWWPKLQQRLELIKLPGKPTRGAVESPEPVKPEIDISEMIEELLHRVRDVDTRVARMEKRTAAPRTVSPSRRDRLEPAASFLKKELEAEGIAVFQCEATPQGIDALLGSDLPSPLPTRVFDAAFEVAQHEKVRVRLLASNRTASFARDGSTDEAPF
ncbi:toll/interleukin-1 receptor domain-containing protein [Schumannella soli]|uniref:toll/interleukin-1 receptor domain-containing protein n=1 Tax=Schumannella soli TaxID=2590779 RepID=UPI0015E86ECD|nr:toll/interleukin-1 receptor domain-containing protein [Schumannella soli]